MRSPVRRSEAVRGRRTGPLPRDRATRAGSSYFAWIYRNAALSVLTTAVLYVVLARRAFYEIDVYLLRRYNPGTSWEAFLARYEAEVWPLFHTRDPLHAQVLDAVPALLTWWPIAGFLVAAGLATLGLEWQRSRRSDSGESSGLAGLLRRDRR